MARGQALLDVHINVKAKKKKKKTIKLNTLRTVVRKVIVEQSIALPQSSAKLNFTKEQLGINHRVNNDPNMCLLAKQNYELD